MQRDNAGRRTVCDFVGRKGVKGLSLWAMRKCHMVLDEELEISATQLMVLGTAGSLLAELWTNVFFP